LLSEIAGGFHGRGRIGICDAEIAPLGSEAAGEGFIVHMPLDAVRPVESGSDLSSIGKPDWEAVAIGPLGFHKRAAWKCLEGFVGVQGDCGKEEQGESQGFFHH
jgi:hypothetical protein